MYNTVAPLKYVENCFICAADDAPSQLSVSPPSAVHPLASTVKHKPFSLLAGLKPTVPTTPVFQPSRTSSLSDFEITSFPGSSMKMVTNNTEPKTVKARSKDSDPPRTTKLPELNIHSDKEKKPEDQKVPKITANVAEQWQVNNSERCVNVPNEADSDEQQLNDQTEASKSSQTCRAAKPCSSDADEHPAASGTVPSAVSSVPSASNVPNASNVASGSSVSPSSAENPASVAANSHSTVHPGQGFQYVMNASPMPPMPVLQPRMPFTVPSYPWLAVTSHHLHNMAGPINFSVPPSVDPTGADLPHSGKYLSSETCIRGICLRPIASLMFRGECNLTNIVFRCQHFEILL